VALAEERKDAPAGKRVLVIDDDKTILDLIAAVLRDEGCSVEAALSGQEALEQSPPEPPQMVVLDMFIPGISGLELAGELRAKYGADLPIIVVSASDVGEEARALGAVAYLPKPFDLEDLLRAVERGLH